MTRGLQRATFNRSALVRLLSEVAPETSDPKYDFGERLGQWLDFSDALTLSSVLNSGAGAASAAQTDAPATASPLRRTSSSRPSKGASRPTAASIGSPISGPSRPLASWLPTSSSTAVARFRWWPASAS